MKKHSKIKREIIDTYIVFKDGNGKSRIIRANETLRNEYKKEKVKKTHRILNLVGI